MFKAQKGSKDIVKLVHVTSFFQPEFYENKRILFVRKENKNKDFIQQFLLFRVSLWCTFTRVPWRTRVILLTQEPADRIFIFGWTIPLIKSANK